jgi:Effector Associated Constant Component 1
MPVPLPYVTSVARRAPERPFSIGAGQRAAQVLEPTRLGPAAALVPARITVYGPDSADLTRDLFGWLTDEPDLRGWVRIVEGEAAQYSLGTGEVFLEAALAPGGAVTAVVTIAVTWLRSRKVSISFSTSDGKRQQSVAVTATSQLGTKDIQELATRLSEMLAGELHDENPRECDGGRHDAA